MPLLSNTHYLITIYKIHKFDGNKGGTKLMTQIWKVFLKWTWSNVKKQSTFDIQLRKPFFFFYSTYNYRCFDFIIEFKLIIYS